MTMPEDLVLVRHGESEGNVATNASKRGDHHYYTPAFRARHSSTWRLTDKGRAQAAIAGDWIIQNIGEQFHRYYTSEYLRARETAACLGLPDARWYAEFYLRERDRGKLDVIDHESLKRDYQDELIRRTIDPFYWTPPGGECLAQVCLRTDRVLDTLHRECEGSRVILVLHGETMLAIRVRLERMSQYRFRMLDDSKHPHHRIHNGQVIHYTRVNPETGEVSPYLEWVRSVCPTDLALSSNVWERIQRPSYTNEQLIENAERIPRLIV